jgi:hypothetical protein
MSIFRAANATTAWPTMANPFEDGPTERLGPAGPDDLPQPPRRALLVALLLAGVAVLLSVGAGLLAWQALGRAEQAGRQPVPAAATVATYADETLRVWAGCGTVTLLDLDEPRVNAPATAGDLRYESECDETASRLALGPGAVAGSRPAEADAGETGCARAIRTSPLSAAASVALSEGLVLCVLTGAPAAAPDGAAAPTGPAPAAPDTGAAGVRLVRVEVRRAGRDGSAELRATSWVAH